MPIQRSSLLSPHPDSRYTDTHFLEQCPGTGCNKTSELERIFFSLGSIKSIPPAYICLDCKLLGWRSRGGLVYAPDEDDTFKEPERK